MATTTIGRALAARRRDTGLDLEAAAARLGVSRSTYSSYERGTRRPSPENLRAVAVFLDVTIDTVLDLYGATCVEQARRVLQPDEVGSAATASDRARRAPRHDVAVIKIEGVSKLPTVTFGKSASLQVGDSVVAVGNALALQGLPTVTQGIVSGLHRSITTSSNGITGGSTTLTDMIQTDAPINPGNSGGPLVNSNGQVIGMNTAIITGTGTEPAQNIGFAEAIDSVLPVVKQIEAHPNSSTSTITAGKAFLGVDIQTMTSQIAAQLGLPANLKGAIVVQVVPGSPAGNAGITAGSVITKVDSTTVTSASELVSAIQKKAPGDRVTIYWTNTNGNGSAVITLGSAPTA